MSRPATSSGATRLRTSFLPRKLLAVTRTNARSVDLRRVFASSRPCRAARAHRPRCIAAPPRCTAHRPRCIAAPSRCTAHRSRCIAAPSRCTAHRPRCIAAPPRCTAHRPRCIAAPPRCTCAPPAPHCSAAALHCSTAGLQCSVVALHCRTPGLHVRRCGAACICGCRCPHHYRRSTCTSATSCHPASRLAARTSRIAPYIACLSPRTAIGRDAAVACSCRSADGTSS